MSHDLGVQEVNVKLVHSTITAVRIDGYAQRQRQQAGVFKPLSLSGCSIRWFAACAPCASSARPSRSQTRLGSGAFSRSTFSEMQHLVEPALLEEVFQELAGKCKTSNRLGPGQVPWRIVDSSVFNVLPRLGWAYFKEHNGKPQSAIRLHVSLDMLSECSRRRQNHHGQGGGAEGVERALAGRGR